MQAAEPVLFLYIDAAHAAHGPPSGPVFPTLHRQPAERVLPLAEEAFAGQLVQAVEPVVSLYIDAAHAVQGPLFGPVYPALHKQLTLSELLCELIGHATKHVALSVPPSSVPALHPQVTISYKIEIYGNKPV